jgi:hypothetical protein
MKSISSASIFSALLLFVSTGCDLDLGSSDDSPQVFSDAAAQVEEAIGTASSGSFEDAIPTGSIVFLDADVSGWAKTANLTGRIGGGVITLDFDKKNEWPNGLEARGGGGINANPWVVANLNGTWYAATFEWFRAGSTQKPTSVVSSSDGHINFAEFKGWQPVSGETYGFLVTTPARGGFRTINERSNIITMVWP